MKDKTIGVIGCGNMASAIMKGIFKKELPYNFITYTPSYTRAESLASKINGRATKDLKDFETCDFVFIGCKPQQLDELSNSLKDIKLSNTHIVSMLAAVNLETIVSKLGSYIVTRIMPNTPIVLGEGITLINHSSEVSQEKAKELEDIMGSISKIYTMESDEQLDKITTISGSGPAYVFLFTEILQNQLTDWGMDKVSSKEMAIALLKGSSSLMENANKKDLSTLISEVTSKGGVTIEAVNSFKENKLDEITREALSQAVDRSTELSSQINI